VTVAPFRPLDWQALAGCAATPFPPGWPPDEYVFFAPRDLGVHDAICNVIASAGHSIVANHYGFDDQEISDLLLGKAANPNVAFILNLDETQAAGAHEKKLLASWDRLVGASVAIGDSMHHAISHLKVTVVDGLYVLSGSTNLSLAGEQKQDNELRITSNPLIAARYSAVIMLNHAEMLRQMAARKQGA
jgi:phosphatidylserine/phosphatidylglycerophosphate/cardiolipin synthase-like enzyme